MTTSLLGAETELDTYDGWLSEGDGLPEASPGRGNGEAVRVMVVVDATKDLTTDALEWALINVVQHGDTVTLLGVIPDGDFLCGVNTKASLQTFMIKLCKCPKTHLAEIYQTESSQLCQCSSGHRGCERKFKFSS